MYKLTIDDRVILIDGDSKTFISMNEENPAYRKYLEWLSEGNTPEPADVPPIPPLDQRISAKWQDIKNYRDNLTQTGGYKVDDKWYHSDTFSRTQQMGMVMMGVNMPENIQWKTMDGSFITMTPLLALRIFNSAADSDHAIFLAAEVHKAKMEVLEHPENYDLTNGWPETYKK